jgi:filamentous hemagglutinin
MSTKPVTPNWSLTPIAYAVAVALLSLSNGNVNAQTGLRLPSGASIVQGANAPIIDGAGSKMTIEQVAPRAIINWNSFNIGAGNRVEFNQKGNTDWSVLNRVVGTERSVINGVLQADGQVFLLNNNGILIGKGAQVNVHTFLASTLTMTDKVFLDGILSLGGTTPFLTAGTGSLAPRGNIAVEAGAIVVSKDGGRISFFASGQVFDGSGNPVLDTDGKPVGIVENNGRLIASNGQVILAAGDKVYIRQPNGDAVTLERGFTGLVVEVDSGGKVANGLLGFIQSRMGNISMVGLTVNQEGRVSATTSVNRNGSIWLMARDTTESGPQATPEVRSTKRGGELTLGATSLTDIFPEQSDANRTVSDVVPFARSQVRLEGKTIHLQGSPSQGALVVAPNAEVLVRARVDPSSNSNPVPGTVEEPAPATAAALVMDKNTRIDVSGLRGIVDVDGMGTNGGVPVAMERNSIRIELRGEQLADAPILRDSAIRSQAIYIDARVGTTLINKQTVDEAIANQTQRSVFEKMGKGGNVEITSTGSVALLPGSTVALRGGSVTYAKGNVRTSRLFDGATVYDVASASNDRKYTKITDALKMRQNGYTEGLAAGKLNIASRNLQLDGNLVGGAVVGEFQRVNAPFSGSFTTNVLAIDPLDLGLRHSLVFAENTRNTLGDFMQRGVENWQPLFDKQFGGFGEDRAQNISPSMLVGSQLSGLTMTTNRGISIAAGSTLNLRPGTDLTLNAKSPISIDRSIRSAAGLLTVGNDSGVTIADNVSLDVSGLWLNESNGEKGQTTAQIDGNEGTRALTNGGTVRFQGGTLTPSLPTVVRFGTNTTVDVSAGAFINPSKRIAGGKGGTFIFGLDPTNPSLPTNLIGYGFTGGSTFRTIAPEFWFGPNAPVSAYTVDIDRLINLGFSTISLSSTERDLVLANGYRLAPSLTQYELPTTAIKGQGESVRSQANLSKLDASRAPTIDLTFNANQPGIEQQLAQSVKVESGANVNLPVGGKMNFNGKISVSVEGNLSAPGGEINLESKNEVKDFGYRPDGGIRVGNGAILDVAGIAFKKFGNTIANLGEVRAGGSINMTAGGDSGTVQVDDTAKINISGTSATFDVAFKQGAQTRYRSTEVASDAGSLTVSSVQGGYFGAAVNAVAGGEGRSFGKFTFQYTAAADKNKADTAIPTTVLNPLMLPLSERQFVMSSSSVAKPVSYSLYTDWDVLINGTRPISNRALDSSQDAFFQRIIQWRISDGSIADAGSLNLLSGEVTRFNSISGLSARESIRVNSSAIRTEPDQKITLSAPLVRLGNDSVATRLVPQVAAIGSSLGVNGAGVAGSLTPSTDSAASTNDKPVNVLVQVAKNNGEIIVNASRGIDLEANTIVQGAGQVTLSSQKDIRLIGSGDFSNGYARGSFSVPGDLSLLAARVFPITQTQYVLNAAQGNLRFGTSIVNNPITESDPSTPYSAFGWLIGAAKNIQQAGSVYAPFGQIDLLASQSVQFAPNSLTSVSGAGINIPLGSISNGTNWSIGTSTLRNPVKSISVNAPSIVVAGASGNAKAANIDASGGGDIIASEFVRGPQGTVDLYSVAGSFAILPSYRSAFSPLVGTDATSTAIAAGSTIRIESGIEGFLPAGIYKVLPASYAQLEGAFLVRPTVTTNLGSAIAGSEATLSRSGINTLIGYRAKEEFGLTSPKAEWFDVLSAAQVRTLAEYRSNTASRFFDSQLASRAQDAGTVKLVAQKALEIIGSVNLAADASAAATANARSGTLEILGDKIRLATNAVSASQQNGTLTISQAKIDEIAAGDLHIGGSVRGNKLVAEAKTIDVDSGVTLKAGTVILTSTDSITMGDQSGIVSSGLGARQLTGGPRSLDISRASSASDSSGSTIIASVQPTVLSRTGTIATAGPQISIGQQALVSGRSVVIDTTGGLTIDSSSQVLGSLDTKLGAQTIILGSATPAIPGFILSGNLLNKLNQSESISLQAYQRMVTFGSQSLGSANTKSLRLDTPTLAAGGLGSALTLTAERINWVRSSVGNTLPNGPTIAGTQLTINTIGNSASDGLRIGAGDKSIDGFANVTMNIGNPGSSGQGSRLDFEGKSSLDIAGNLTAKVDQIQSSLVVDRTKVTIADAAINVAGTASFVRNTSQALAAGNEGPGGKLSVKAGGDLTFDTTAKLPSGEIVLSSTGGNLNIGSQAVLNVAGFQKPIFEERIELQGGTVRLNVDNTNAKLTVADGATIDVSAANNIAGSIEIRSAGTLALGQASQLKGGSQLESKGGALVIDARQGVNLDQLAKASIDGGFTRSLDIRARSGDLELSQASGIKTETVVIAADNGKINLAGNIDASSAVGGKVEIWQRGTAGQVLTIKDSARINVAGETGGEVTLGSTNGIVVAGRPEIRGGSADNRRAGTLTLRAPRTGATTSGTGIAISQAAPGAAIQVLGRVETSLEGVRVANPNDPGLSFANTLQSATPATNIATDVAAYRANAATILANVPVQSTGLVQVLAGIELLGAAGLNLTTSATTLDFAASNIGLGSLTVRSSGDLTLAGSISDGVSTFTQGSVISSTTLARNSWSYRFAAGADFNAANPLAVTATPKNLTISATRDVRTGTGSIGLASSGQVVFDGPATTTPANSTFANRQPGSVYTVGRLAGISDGYVVAPGYFNTNSQVARTQGGSVTVRAAGIVRGTDVQTTPSHWLRRQGVLDQITGVYSVAPGWVPEVGTLIVGTPTATNTTVVNGFNMHLGSLAGGKLTVDALGTENLYLANVSSGRMRSVTPDSAALEVINKAPTTITVAENIVGGQFMSMDGALSLSAGRSVGENSTGKAPILLQGNNPITVTARDGVNVSRPFNPTALTRDSTTVTFNTFGDKSDFKVASSGIVIVGDATGDNQVSKPSVIQGIDFAKLIAPNWAVQSASNILVGMIPGSFLAPTDNRRFSLLADHNIITNSTGNTLVASAVDPNSFSYLVPQPANGLTSPLNANRALPTLENGTRQPIRLYAAQGDIAPDLEANQTNQSIASIDNTMLLNFPQSVHLKAGRDIRNLSLTAQNQTDADQTLVQAGRDVVTLVRSDGSSLVASNAKIEVSGPGTVVVSAGRDIRFGTVGSGREVAADTIGNNIVAALPTRSAALVLIAGVKGQPAYGVILDTYLKPDAAGAGFDQSRHLGLALDALTSAGKAVGSSSPTAVWNAVQTLNQAQREQLARNIFFQELRIAGGADTNGILRDFVAPAPGNNQSARFSGNLVSFVTSKGDTTVNADNAWSKFQALPEVNKAEFVSQVALPLLLKDKVIPATDLRIRDYARGYKATALMFPTDGVGNIDLVYNTVRSQQGGPVQLLAPGTICKDAPANCASAESSYQSDKTVGNIFVGLVNPPSTLTNTARLGIFGLSGANVEGFAGNNVEVNNSRIVAGGGGDLLLWSSGGNIDAGRGSKAAVSVPPPVIKINPQGVVTVDFSSAIEGSGIRAFSSDVNAPAGEVSLYAPKGTINAGDAGIQGGNVSVGGAVILNAENIRLAADPNSGANISGSVAPISLAPAPTSNTADAANKAVEAAASDRAKRVRVIVVDFEGFGVDCKLTPQEPSCKQSVSGLNTPSTLNQ